MWKPTNSIGIALFLLITGVQALAAEDGVWVSEENFAQINVACVRVYICRPGEDIMYSSDMQLKVSEPQTQTGICSAGSGPIDSCNVCLTNPPSEPCTWTLEPK